MKKFILGTAIYSLIISILFLFSPKLTFRAVSFSEDDVYRALAAIMVILAIIILVKDKTASIAGKILLIVGGGIILAYSSQMG